MSKHKNGSTRRKNAKRAERRAYRARKRARDRADQVQTDKADGAAPVQEQDHAD